MPGVGGDASMELVMAAQDDPTPWLLDEFSSKDLGDTGHDAPVGILHGRGFFSELGIVRRKPCQYEPLVLNDPYRDASSSHRTRYT